MNPMEPSQPADELRAASPDLDRILDIPLEIHVQLGSRRMRIEELLAAGIGTVIDLGTPADAPLRVYANDTLIAHGEAVVVADRYGIRITDIVSPRERVRRIAGNGGEP